MSAFKLTALARACLLDACTPLRKAYVKSRLEMYGTCTTRVRYSSGAIGFVYIYLMLSSKQLNVKLYFSALDEEAEVTIAVDRKHYDLMRKIIYMSTTQSRPATHVLSNIILFMMESRISWTLEGGSLDGLPF